MAKLLRCDETPYRAPRTPCARHERRVTGRWKTGTGDCAGQRVPVSLSSFFIPLSVRPIGVLNTAQRLNVSCLFSQNPSMYFRCARWRCAVFCDIQIIVIGHLLFVQVIVENVITFFRRHSVYGCCSK